MKTNFSKIYTILLLSFFSLNQRVFAARDCKQVLGDNIVDFIVDIFNMIKWIALALGLVLGMLDFFKAISDSKDGALAKAAQKFVKRLIAIVILFILPVLLEWILDISGIEHGGTCLD